ncbi:unnamed protein product [Clonostachys rhizophaga]|uniref:Uncharacterized protein n=1 Tax=Clonostachys rhizophaga TaxID=160324 RepID=A0A9N9VMZ9_9HYPO|nr:unnamed protein product [Clonostachys rhizophaga]
MDIRSGIVSWPYACPGGFIKKLQSQYRGYVRKIKSLDTCYAKNSSWDTYARASDLGIVHKFIRTIDALEVLSIRTLEEDVSGLWPVIFRQGSSLTSLTFRPYRDCNFIAVTPQTVSEIASRLPRLVHLGIDVSLQDAEAALKPPEQPQEESSIDELVKMSGLREVELFIKLPMEPSSFCARNTFSSVGTTSNPPIKPKVSLRLAEGIFNKFLTHDAQSSLERVSIHFLRNSYEDRGQYSALHSTAWVELNETGFEKQVDRSWQSDPAEMSSEVWKEIRQADSEFAGGA